MPGPNNTAPETRAPAPDDTNPWATQLPEPSALDALTKSHGP